MTDTTTETRTVQKYRHAARAVLTQARETLAVRTDATREVYRLLNGTIEEVIRGVTGLSQDEQVARLNEAKAKAEENRAKIAEAVAAAKAEVLAQVEAWDFDSALAETIATLEEAAEFAASRDFASHQEAKHAGRYGYSGGSPSDEEDGEEDGF